MTIKYLKRVVLLFLVSAMLFAMMAPLSASAVSVGFERLELDYLHTVKDKNVWKYKTVSVRLGDKRIPEVSYLINDTTYIPLRAAATLAGAAVTYNAAGRSATVRMPGLEMTVSDGGYVVHANERALFSRSPSMILSDGRMYIPVRVLASALSLSVEWRAPGTVILDGTPKPILHGSKFYSQDDLYWLSRIINAESRGEPLLGQLAVGSVVMNRVKHRDYPSTIWGVIFDKKYGVQFSPVNDGSIYNNPTYLSLTAAKICLEGVRISDKILFFLEPTKANSAWIVLNRPYAFTVANHYFFN